MGQNESRRRRQPCNVEPVACGTVSRERLSSSDETTEAATTSRSPLVVQGGTSNQSASRQYGSTESRLERAQQMGEDRRQATLEQQARRSRHAQVRSRKLPVGVQLHSNEWPSDWDPCCSRCCRAPLPHISELPVASSSGRLGSQQQQHRRRQRRRPSGISQVSQHCEGAAVQQAACGDDEICARLACANQPVIKGRLLRKLAHEALPTTMAPVVDGDGDGGGGNSLSFIRTTDSPTVVVANKEISPPTGGGVAALAPTSSSAPSSAASTLSLELSGSGCSSLLFASATTAAATSTSASQIVGAKPAHRLDGCFHEQHSLCCGSAPNAPRAYTATFSSCAAAISTKTTTTATTSSTTNSTSEQLVALPSEPPVDSVGQSLDEQLTTNNCRGQIKAPDDESCESQIKSAPTCRKCKANPNHSPATRSADLLAWNGLARKYNQPQQQPGNMTRRTSKSAAPGDQGSTPVLPPPPQYAGRRNQRTSRSNCLCHLICALLQTLFPVVGELKNYSLPGDLVTDMAAGFTVAVLHIPQGMAYGLLSGVEPIYGLYVSFIPVLVMSLMSRSRHVSYGTFAVISMLLVNTVDNVRANFGHEFQLAPNATLTTEPTTQDRLMVIKDNHQASEDLQQKQHLLRNLIRSQQQQSTSGPVVELLAMDTGALPPTMASVSLNQQLPMEPPTSIEILACACLVCGLIHITMSLMRLGVLSLMFSDQLVSSFTTASAIHVLTSQLAGLFDLTLAPIHEELFKIVRIWWQFGNALLFEPINQTTALLSLSSIAFLLFIKQLVEPALRSRFRRLTCLPSELALMAIVIFCSWYFKFESNYKVKIIGYVPTGLPEARLPRLELVPYVLKDSLTIALISFAMNLSIAQVYAKRFRYELDANQELFAIGTANIVSSFFSCFPCASSLSRSSVQSSLNVKSQLCSLFSCALVVLIICFFAHILHDLPRSTLSCIIVVALKGILMQVRDLYDNWRLSKMDALVWLVTFIAVIVFGVTFGLILGIIASLFMIFLRLLTPNHSILGRIPETEIYVDVNAFTECEEIERVKIFRFNSALCYLNRTQLRTKIEQILPSIYKPQGFSAICSQFHQRHSFEHQQATPPINFLIIDCSALSYCDYSGAATLIELIEDLERDKVTVYLAACPLKLIDMLGKMKATGQILSENVFPTISVAIGQVRYLLSTREGSSEKQLGSPTTASQHAPSFQVQKEQQQTTSPVSEVSDPKASYILDVP